MEQLIFCILIWLAVFLIVPVPRIKDLGIVAIIAFTWMVLVDNVSTHLGFYRYQNSLLFIGAAPVFQNLAEAGLGILMIYWLKEGILSKLIEVLIVGVSFVILHAFYIHRGVLSYETFNHFLNLVHHIVALSIFIWLSLVIAGKQRVYKAQGFL